MEVPSVAEVCCVRWEFPVPRSSPRRVRKRRQQSARSATHEECVGKALDPLASDTWAYPERPTKSLRRAEYETVGRKAASSRNGQSSPECRAARLHYVRWRNTPEGKRATVKIETSFRINGIQAPSGE